ncbi:MAG: hypothetical protein PHF18_05580 [Methanosarcina sp.]|nr:hypothetical protein [Methanosarcina sp.]MDD3246310.1 hypothetical protein [Methanosarcina sp.]MDD4248383.1 hypothetical protein [Methanosarcina sp.]
MTGKEPLLDSLARIAAQFYRDASKVTFGGVVANLYQIEPFPMTVDST